MPLSRLLTLFALFTMLIVNLNADYRYEVIEDFESGAVVLDSWADQDIQPSAWNLDSTTTYGGSQYALKLSGNTWKTQSITPVTIAPSTVFQTAIRHTNGGATQGIGFSDGTNQLFYSISGNAILNLDIWIPVYQGAFSQNTWNQYHFPLGTDWQAFFGYIPTISSIIYINDMDAVTPRSVWFDSILNITSDLPQAPQVSILHNSPTWKNSRDVAVQFYAVVSDPDSDTFSYMWNFGDGNSSTEQNPLYTFTVTDAHQYTVALQVTDSTGRIGLASTQLAVDEGPSSLPLTLNFVGDVMLARRYENYVIPTFGVNSIFTPTLPLLGEGADVTVANLEVVLANTGSPHPTKSVVYRGNPAYVSALGYAGIDIVSLANNHTMDYGLTALQQMQGLLQNQGIYYSGAGVDAYDAYKPAFVNRKGLNVAFLRNCDRTGQYNNAQPFLQAGYNKSGFAYMTPFYIEEQISTVQNVADLKIVEMHGGSEYSTAPGSGYDKSNPFLGDTDDEDYSYRTDVPHQWDIDIRHSAIDSGADMVIVHHPHIIQGLEIYNGKLIAHSLGNFAFDLDYPECMPSMILYADAVPGAFQNYRVKPVYIDGYIPKPATGRLGIQILDYLAMKSRELNTILAVDKEQMIATVLTEPPFTQQHTHQTTKDFYTTMAGFQYTEPIKLPRYGNISAINSLEPVTNADVRYGSELIWFGNMEDEGSNLWSMADYSPDAIDGDRCGLLSLTGSGTLNSTIGKRMKLYDNTKSYTLHGWIKTRNAGSANITIRYFNSRTSSQISSESVTGNLSGTSAWTWYHNQLTIPSNAWYYDIQVNLTGAASQTSQAWFDNVGVIEWTPWQLYDGANLIPYPNDYYWLQIRTSEAAKSITANLTETSVYALVPDTLPSQRIKDAPLSVFPNPFNPDTNISFSLDMDGKTCLKVYNLKGQLVRTILNDNLTKGSYTIAWDGKDNSGISISSGVYIFQLTHGKQSKIGKAILLK